jgi:hypothetical protein
MPVGFHMRTVAVIAASVVACVSAGCGAINLAEDECAGPEVPPAAPGLSPIAKALHFLQHTQLITDVRDRKKTDWEGDWPQCFARDRNGPYIRDVSPFSPTFIHHALSLINEANADALGLSQADVDAAREMRLRAVQFIRRFAVDPPCPDAGTFGFWPHAPRSWKPGDLSLARAMDRRLEGPQFMGVLAPLNVSFYPRDFRIPTDADVTANVYAALLDHQTLDGGEPVDVAFEDHLIEWRDLGQVPQRNVQPWLPDESGAFLTWLAYHDDPSMPNLNDVDLVVNANVLYALGRYRRLDVPGADEAVALINTAIESGAHLADPNRVSLYYPDNLTIHHAVLRAWDEGAVKALTPAAERLVQDLLDTVSVDELGQAFWDRGDPHLNTALAALALLSTAEHSDLVDAAVAYLESQQDPIFGGWDLAVFFVGRMDNGAEVLWVSSALTTAFALEAIARNELVRAAGG